MRVTGVCKWSRGKMCLWPHVSVCEYTCAYMRVQAHVGRGKRGEECALGRMKSRPLLSLAPTPASRFGSLAPGAEGVSPGPEPLSDQEKPGAPKVGFFQRENTEIATDPARDAAPSTVTSPHPVAQVQHGAGVRVGA